MTSGEIYLGEDRFFGPAYQDAYRLERKACYPRIAVDLGLFKTLYDELLQYEPKHPRRKALNELKHVISKDDDGIWFVDYLRIHRDAVEDNGDALRFLIRHRDVISEGLRTFAGDCEVLPKYWWMRRYHNRCVGELREKLLREMGTSQHELRVLED